MKKVLKILLIIFGGFFVMSVIASIFASEDETESTVEETEASAPKYSQGQIDSISNEIKEDLSRNTPQTCMTRQA